jgi:hypothetical protein
MQFFLDTPAVNFINIFCALFCTKDNCVTFSSYILALAKDFGAKNVLSHEKRTRLMLMKLTPGVNFTNILRVHFLANILLSKRQKADL